MTREAPGDTWRPEELERVERCPMCASSAREMLYRGLVDREFGTRGLWTLHRCDSCGSVYLDPRPRAAVIGRAYASYYTHEPVGEPRRGLLKRLRVALRHGYLNDVLGYSLEPALPQARVVTAPFPGKRRVARLTVRDLSYPGPGGRLLDVGCGSGALLVDMAAAGWHVEGIDPDPRAVEVARQRGLVVHQGTLESVRVAEQSFDAVTLDHVLEHLPEPMSALERCRAFLREGGYLWLRTPNVVSPGHQAYGADWPGLDAPRHLVLPTPAALRSALERLSFEVCFLRPPGSLFMLKQSRWLRSQRLGRGDRVSPRMRAAWYDFRARRSVWRGEELVVLARRRD